VNIAALIPRPRFTHSHQRSNHEAGSKNLCPTEHPLPLLLTGHTAEVLWIYISPFRARLTRHRTISSLGPLFLFPWLRVSSPQGQAGRGAAEREYDYVVVGVYKLFNRQSNCTRVLLADVPAHSYPSRLQILSLCAYLRAPQSLGANLNKDSLSMFPPRLSPFSLTFPDACGHVRDVFLDPDFVWGFRSARISSSRRTRRCC
jgi:hypothetical protein